MHLNAVSNRAGQGGIVAAWLAAVIALAMAAVSRKSVTVDEYHHLPLGCHVLCTGDVGFDRKSPPLARVWCALPAVALGAEVPREAVWTQFGGGWTRWIYGTAFQVRNAERYDRLYFWGRLMNALWLLPLGVALFAWTGALFGRPAAWIALFLLGLCPTILAHAPLVTSDMAATTTFFLSVYCLWRSGSGANARSRVWWAVGTGVSGGVGMLAKYTVLLLPVVWAAAAGVLLCVRRPEGSTEARDTGASWTARRAAGRVLLLVGIPCVVALLVVNVGYAFRGTGVSVRDTPRVSRLFSAVSAGAVGAMPLPLPRDYVIGFDEQKADNERGEFPCYLIGQWSTSGWWYYYPLAFVLKSPVPFLLLLLLPLVPPVRRRLAASRWSCACLLLPVIVMLGVLCIGNRLDIGIRYALPAFPFLTAMAAGVAGVLWGRRRTLPLAVLVLVWYAGSTLSAYPDFLAYFSEAVGGAREGHRYLLDSNLDWGQDLKELKRYMDRTGIPSVHLAYFGHVWPQQYGIRFSVLGSRPAPGYVAASVALVMGQPYAITYAGDRVLPVPAGMFTWLQRYRPVGRAGRSIWIYDIPADKLPSE